MDRRKLQINITKMAIIYISPFVDEEDCYVTPKILVETEVMQKLEFKEVVLIEDKLFNITVLEIGESHGYQMLQTKPCPDYGMKEGFEEVGEEDCKGTVIDSENCMERSQKAQPNASNLHNCSPCVNEEDVVINSPDNRGLVQGFSQPFLVPQVDAHINRSPTQDGEGNQGEYDSDVFSRH